MVHIGAGAGAQVGQRAGPSGAAALLCGGATRGSRAQGGVEATGVVWYGRI